MHCDNMFSENLMIDRIKYNLEKIFYLMLVLYTCNQVFSESQFINIPVMAKLLKIVRYTVLAGLVLVILLKDIRIEKKAILILAILLFFVLLNFLVADGGMSYLPIVLFVIASRNCSLSKIFKYTAYTLVVAHLLLILSASLGIVEDTVEYRYIDSFMKGNYYRHNMGLLVHNQIAMCLLIVYLYVIAYKRENLKFVENLIFMILNYVVFLFFGSRTVFLLSILSCVLFCVIKYIIGKGSKCSKWWWLVYPCFAVLSVVSAACYKSNNIIWKLLNILFNNRLIQGNTAIRYYGISIIGNGQNAGLYGSNYSTNFTVDNGYMYILISSGLAVMIILVSIWSYLTYFCAKKNNKYMVLVLLILAVENLINTHLGSFKLIPFFCILANNDDAFLNCESVTARKMKPKLSQIGR